MSIRQLKQVLRSALDFFLIYVKMTNNKHGNDCFVKMSDLILVKKQLKYFDVPLEHALKVPDFSRINLEDLDNEIITELVDMLCNT